MDEPTIHDNLPSESCPEQQKKLGSPPPSKSATSSISLTWLPKVNLAHGFPPGSHLSVFLVLSETSSRRSTYPRGSYLRARIYPHEIPRRTLHCTTFGQAHPCHTPHLPRMDPMPSRWPPPPCHYPVPAGPGWILESAIIISASQTLSELLLWASLPRSPGMA